MSDRDKLRERIRQLRNRTTTRRVQLAHGVGATATPLQIGDQR